MRRTYMREHRATETGRVSSSDAGPLPQAHLAISPLHSPRRQRRQVQVERCTPGTEQLSGCRRVNSIPVSIHRFPQAHAGRGAPVTARVPSPAAEPLPAREGAAA